MQIDLKLAIFLPIKAAERRNHRGEALDPD